MLDIEKVNTLQNSVPVLAKTGGEQFLHQFAELTAQTLSIYFVGIYMVDQTKEYLVLQAGNGAIGKRLCKSGFKERINPSLLNCAAAVYHGEVILVEWLERIKISSYSISVNSVHESKSELLPPDFLYSPVLPQARTELRLPSVYQIK